MLRRITPFSDEKVSIIHFFNFETSSHLSCSLVLNQDFQDFEDYLVLGVVWDGESGFTGF
jgi:hypothetical protein